MSDAPSSVPWSPTAAPVTREDFDTCAVLVVHYWAVWDLHDREMDKLLAPVREAYVDRICFRSCDTDRAENRPFIRGIAAIPALGCFIHGAWHQSLIGLRSVEELRVVFVKWMAAADAHANRTDIDTDSPAMTDAHPPNPVLPDATRPSTPSSPSRYAFASLAVSVLALLWLGLAILNTPLPFSPSKQHRIGCVASVLALILAFAAYRQPDRGRSLAHAAVTAAGMAFLAYFLLTPI